MSRQEIFNELKELIKLANSSDDSALEKCTEESDLRAMIFLKLLVVWPQNNISKMTNVD